MTAPRSALPVPTTCRSMMCATPTSIRIAEAVKAIAAQNPKFAQAIVLKEDYGLTVSEIAQKLNDTERNIYYYLEQAKRIGRQYKRDNE